MHKFFAEQWDHASNYEFNDQKIRITSVMEGSIFTESLSFAGAYMYFVQNALSYTVFLAAVVWSPRERKP